LNFSQSKKAFHWLPTNENCFKFVVDNFKRNMVRQLSAVIAQKKADQDARNAKAAKPCKQRYVILL
jgi:hypothetical protein